MGLFDIKGRVALVTGGNGGIGLAMAKAFAEAGASVVISGRDAGKGAAALAELKELGTAHFIESDIANPEHCSGLADKGASLAGPIDILVNNAGLTVRKRPETLSLAEWTHVLEVNLTAAFALSQAVYPMMKVKGSGKIINIGSMLSIFGAPFAAAYGASKGGLVQLTKSLATAWAADNIQVNAILPGWIDTAMGAAARAQVKGLEERVTARTPAARWGTTDDIKGAALFFASPASDFVTGTALPVDGGYSIAG